MSAARPVGRPREYGERVTTSVRIPPDLHERLAVAAADRDLSVNRCVLLAVAEWLDHLIPVEELFYTRRERP